MAPRSTKERPANLRQKPKKSAKAAISSGSSSPAASGGSERESSAERSSGHEQVPGTQSGAASPIQDDGSVLSFQGPVDQGDAGAGHAVGVEAAVNQILGEIKSLQASVESLHQRQGRYSKRIKAVEGELQSRKRARSSDMSSSDKEGRSKVKSRKRCYSRSSSSSCHYSSDDSDNSGTKRRESTWGASIPIDASVSERIKKRIWKGKFVEFRYLLDPEERPAKQRKLQLKISAVDSEVHSVAAQEPGPLASFSLWDKAFHVFLSIFMKKCKGNSSQNLDNLLIYRRTIETMHLAGGDWERYDTKFRTAMAVLPKKEIQWERRQFDLLDDCIRRREHEAKKPGQSSSSKGNSSRFFQGGKAKGFCFVFQKYGKCDKRDDCHFKHACSNCNATAHGQLQCPKTKSSSSLPPSRLSAQ